MAQTNTPPRSGVISQITKMPMEKTFRVSYYSPTDDRTYEGTFLVRRPTLVQQMQITAKKSHLLGGLFHDETNPGVGVPEEMDTLAEMMAFLTMCVVDGPPWWGEELYDPGVLFAIFSEAVNIDPFRGLPVEQTMGGSSPGRTGEDRDHQRDGAGHNDRAAALVDEEVQDPGDQFAVEGQPPR